MRLRRDLSLDRLGSLVGLSYQQIQKYERGISRINASVLWKLSRVLDVSVLQFFAGLPGIEEQPEQAPTERIDDPLVRHHLDALIKAVAGSQTTGNGSFRVRQE